MLVIWEERKQKLYGEDSCPRYLQSLAGDLGVIAVQGTGRFGPGEPRVIEYMCVLCMCMCV